MERRLIDGFKGDRVARIPGTHIPAKSFVAAMDYAALRAQHTGKRQTLRRHNRHGWWIVLCSETPINIKAES